MSLKINFDWKKCIKWVAIGAVGIFLLVFFIRVATWEDHYYREMEGSERAVQATEEETLDETEIDEDTLNSYEVPAGHPKFLEIESLNIGKSRILPVGVNAEKELGTPVSIYDVGWYDASSNPGNGGTLVMDGHNGGPTKTGIFKRLPELAIGAKIKITRGDNEVFYYEVVENDTVSLEDSGEYMKSKAMFSPEKGRESLTLITCTGEWNGTTYNSRQFVRALLVE